MFKAMLHYVQVFQELFRKEMKKLLDGGKQQKVEIKEQGQKEVDDACFDVFGGEL